MQACHAVLPRGAHVATNPMSAICVASIFRCTHAGRCRSKSTPEAGSNHVTYTTVVVLYLIQLLTQINVGPNRLQRQAGCCIVCDHLLHLLQRLEAKPAGKELQA